MRKFSFIIISALMMSLMTACGNNMMGSKKATPSPTAAATATPKADNNKDMGDAAGDMAKDAGNAAGDAVKGVSDVAGDAVKGTGNAVGDVVNGTSDAVGGAVRDMGDGHDDGADGITDKASEINDNNKNQ